MSSARTASPSRDTFDTLRSAVPDVLSLALMEVRNRTLAWVAAFEAAGMGAPIDDGASGLGHDSSTRGGDDALLHVLGGVAWFQERWIARNVHRDRGAAGDRTALRLTSVRPAIDGVYDPPSATADERAAQAAGLFGDLQGARDYAAETFDITLDLLERIDPARDDLDDALAVFRAALLEEAALDEAFAARAQALDLALVAVEPGALVVAAAPRPPVLVPATRWRLGAERPGHVVDDQAPPQVVAMPEFEVDAQPVTWSQYAEFVADGGYDDPSHWGDAGWAWCQRLGRRTPRHVEQMRHGTLQRRFGRTVRVPPQGPVVHVTAHEAEAWCRWAGRRLPGEAEWEAAAHLAASRGFRWGSVREWTATTWRPYPGYASDPWRRDEAAFGLHRATRGASFATAAPCVSARLRGHAPLDHDAGFMGFRSCAL